MSAMTALLANLDLSRVSDLLTIAARVVAGLVGGVIGYFVTGPVARVLYRLAFQRPIPEGLVMWAKVAGAIVVAVLVFLLFTFGLGGSGGFGFGGDGWGFGKGGHGDGKGDKEGHKETSPGKGKDKETPPEKTLAVEIFVPRYEVEGTKRYYLVRETTAEPQFANVKAYQERLKTLGDVEALLKQNAGRWTEMNIITYRNTPEQGGPLVENLTKLAREHKLAPNLSKLSKDRVVPE
jgi:hypothetical protein